MAEADIDAIIATADNDTTWGDDMRGAITTLRGTRPHVTAATGTRYTSSRNPRLMLGPFTTYATTATMGPGEGQLGWTYVRSGTPSTVEINVVAALTTGQFYYALYNWDATGGPTTVAVQWGPFTGTATGTAQLTAQTNSITQGYYWAGVYVDSAATGTISFTGARSAISPVGGTANQIERSQLQIGNQTANTPPTLTTYTIDGSTTSTRLACSANTFPILLGFS